MCTTGVLRLADGRHALFKNKDFGRDHLEDLVWLDTNLFGVMGMTTWDSPGSSPDSYSGFSIGANRHGLLCCDSNVATLAGLRNYDDMTAVALSSDSGVAGAVDAVEASCAAGAVSWANLVMIDADSAAAIEIRGDVVHVTELDAPTARSNHHLVLGPHELVQEARTTGERLGSAQRRLDRAQSLDDVFDLLGSHDSADTGVCNHAELTTVYSYVLVAGDGIDLHVVQGRPCGDGPRLAATLPFDEPGSARVTEFLEAYPTADRRNAAQVWDVPWSVGSPAG